MGRIQLIEGWRSLSLNRRRPLGLVRSPINGCLWARSHLAMPTPKTSASTTGIPKSGRSPKPPNYGHQTVLVISKSVNGPTVSDLLAETTEQSIAMPQALVDHID